MILNKHTGPAVNQGRRHGATIGEGGRGPFEVDSFHAPPIGIMLNAEKFSGDRPPVPASAAAHAASSFRLTRFLLSNPAGW